jgi:hypothetical protein
MPNKDKRAEVPIQIQPSTERATDEQTIFQQTLRYK